MTAQNRHPTPLIRMPHVSPSTRQILPVIIALMATAGFCATSMADSTAAGIDAGQHQRTMGLLQKSLAWVRRGQETTATSGATSASAPVIVATRTDASTAAIPISSSAARDQWIGENFFLRGEDHEAEQSDRVRVGFETDRIPGLSNNLSVDGNWSTSQRPGDSTMDMGLTWRVPMGDNQLEFRGRIHEYENEVDDGDVKRFGGTRQTLEIDLARSLYRGDSASLDARVITTDVTRRWYQDGDLSDESRRSYSLLRLDGQVERYLPMLDTYGDLGFSVEGCVALTEGAEQESCGEGLGTFQRYNLSANLRRQWLNMDWALQGEYQFTPNELPSWRYMEVGPGMMHGFGGQALRGREGGWLRLDSQTRSRPLWSPMNLYTSIRFSLLRGWAEAAVDPHLTSRASVAEVFWRVSGEHLSGGLRAGTLLDSAGPDVVTTHVPDVSVDLTWTL
ncbi:ShlB/FhaC/HecB family hemolysin secretion/activation protein [Marinobacter sp. OP 3.4]|uniref:ShlB/FhaC/HecB family hemolysin secretion/activation protein n=1 Tax=Marinobacter sp. OP 3.4 TaxID=3076501 RepID=UPI002E1D8189